MNTRKTVKIAFIFQVPSFWPTWETLYESCCGDGRFEVRMFWLHGANGDFYQMCTSEEFLKANGIPYTRFSFEEIMRFSPDYMIYQTPFDKGHRPDEAWTIRYRRKGIKIVYIPYGIEISDMKEGHIKHFDRSVVLNSFAVYTLSEAMRGEYKKWCLNARAARAFGLPRFDGLRKTFTLPGDVKDRAGDRIILLWKVHFPKYFTEQENVYQATPALDEYRIFAEWLTNRNDFFVIFMPHPKFFEYEKFKEDGPIAEKIVSLLKENENVYIDTSDDYRRSLTNADAIIIDRSTVMVEAAVRNVPILYMHHHLFEEPMTPPVAHLLDTYGNGSSANDMIDFCKKVLSGADESKDRRKAAFEDIVPYDGKCSERIKDDLMARVSEQWPDQINPRFMRTDRVILFGTEGIFKNVLQEIQASLDERRVEILAATDNNPNRWGGRAFGVPIIKPADIPSMEFRYIIIASDNYHRDIFLQLTEELKIPKEKILNYDEFIVMLKYE